MRILLRLLTPLVLASLVAGCNTAPVRDPAYAPVRPVIAPPAPMGNGAIYQTGYERSWFEDMRARRVGDMLTVKLAEKTDAKKEATTSVKKDSTTIITNPTILGSTPQFNTQSFIPLASNKDNTLAFNLQSANDFSGEGESAHR